MNMNKILKNQIVAHRNAQKLENKLYNIISILAQDAGSSAYIDELGDVKSSTENTIIDIIDINEDYEHYDDIKDEIIELLESDKKIDVVIDELWKIKK